MEAARNAPKRYAQLVSNIEDVANLLAPHGWIAFGAIPSDRYQEAAQLVADGDSEAAEDLLTKAWEERLDFALRPLQSLYADQTRRRIGHGARPLGRERRSRATKMGAMPVPSPTLTEIDGIVYDMTGKDAKSFYASGKKAGHLTDDKTIPRSSERPRGAQRAIYQRPQTHDFGWRARRHRIVHGRELGYDTKRNAIKTFVALFAVVEWAAPKDTAVAERLELAREERYAGSDETDEWGCRLDRRGFDSVQNVLTTIQLYVQVPVSRVRICLRCARTRGDRRVLGIPGIEMVISADGRCFRVWAPTEGGYSSASLTGR